MMACRWAGRKAGGSASLTGVRSAVQRALNSAALKDGQKAGHLAFQKVPQLAYLLASHLVDWSAACWGDQRDLRWAELMALGLVEQMGEQTADHLAFRTVFQAVELWEQSLACPQAARWAD